MGRPEASDSTSQRVRARVPNWRSYLLCTQPIHADRDISPRETLHPGSKTLEPSRQLATPDTPTDLDALGANQADLPRHQGRKESAMWPAT